MLIRDRFQEWRKDYGDVIGLKFGLTNVVILNSFKHVKEWVLFSIFSGYS
jgi:hypothetical protein